MAAVEERTLLTCGGTCLSSKLCRNRKRQYVRLTKHKLEADVEERRKQNEREEKAWKTEDATRKLDEKDAEQNSRAT